MFRFQRNHHQAIHTKYLNHISSWGFLHYTDDDSFGIETYSNVECYSLNRVLSNVF